MQFQDDIATALYVVSPGAAIFTKYRLKHISKLRKHQAKHGNSRSVFDDLIPSDPSMSVFPRRLSLEPIFIREFRSKHKSKQRT